MGVENVVPALVATILRAPHEHEWSIQGFGMLRLYLTKAIRLHIWDPSRAVESVTTIHDHPWNFTSHVVCGLMTDRVYRRIGDDEWPANGRPKTHREERIVCGPGGGSMGAIREVRLEKTTTTHVRAGECYSRRAEELHESGAMAGTVTIVERTFMANTEHALVYAPIGQPWVSAEPRRATREEVEHFVTLARDLMAQEVV